MIKLDPKKLSLLTIKETCEFLTISEQQLGRIRKAENSDFPQPYVVGDAPKSRNVYSSLEIIKWLESRQNHKRDCPSSHDRNQY